jgi:hypothetical protein
MKLFFFHKGFIWKFLSYNEKSKYKCFLTQIQDNVVYVRSHFVTLVGFLKIKSSNNDV